MLFQNAVTLMLLRRVIKKQHHTSKVALFFILELSKKYITLPEKRKSPVTSKQAISAIVFSLWWTKIALSNFVSALDKMTRTTLSGQILPHSHLSLAKCVRRNLSQFIDHLEPNDFSLIFRVHSPDLLRPKFLSF